MNLSTSPWGDIQTQENFAPGIVRVYTASHGGFFISKELRDRLIVQETRYSKGGFFEEDCDWSIVAISFPEYFSEKDLSTAKFILNRYHPELSHKISA